MKKTVYIVVITILAVCCLIGAAGSVGASDVMISEPISKPAVDLDAVVQRKVNDAIVAERYEMFTIEKPEHCTYDPSVRLLEYNVGTDYWDRVTSADYSDLTGNIDGDYPTIYIPLYGETADPTAGSSDRVIGHIKLSYDPVKGDYGLNMSLYSSAEADDREQRPCHFLETIADYIRQSEAPVRQVFLIRYPSSLTDEQEKIAVVQTGTGVVILDITDTCQTVSYGEKPVPYSVEEYRVLRKKVEKTVYRTAEDPAGNPAGGYPGSSDNGEKDSTAVWIITALAVAGVSAAGVGLIYKKKHL